MKSAAERQSEENEKKDDGIVAFGTDENNAEGNSENKGDF